MTRFWWRPQRKLDLHSSSSRSPPAMNWRAVISACVIFVVSLLSFRSEAARLWFAPKPKRRVVRDVAEIPVGRQHDKFVADAKLGEQRINGSDLSAVLAAFVA